jgi:hypothetical protein
LRGWGEDVGEEGEGWGGEGGGWWAGGGGEDGWEGGGHKRRMRNVSKSLASDGC